MTNLLEVRDLSTYFTTPEREVKAVDGVSFALNKAETFCLVGESGSGKSITALSVMRLLPARISSHPSGSIWFNGVDLLKQDDEAMRHIRGSQIAMIFQEPMTSLNPVFTIGDQITEALQLHHPEMSNQEVQERTVKALEQVHLPNARGRMRDYPHQLSGGQRQRVMIAMALACDPELLIADEPTTALDVTVQAEILRLMRELQDNTGMSILMITHDFGVVAQMAHQVGVMQYGKLVEQGSTKQVLSQPQHPYTQQLLAAVPENLARRKPTTAQVLNADAKPLIEIHNLSVWFPIKKGLFRRTVDYVKAVDDVSLAIPKGQIMALVGESGCGKTTLGRAILQLEKPTQGSVNVEGQELVGLSDQALRPWRAKMQIVFQDPQSSLNPRLLVETMLTEPMKVHGIGSSHEERLELAARTLEHVQLKREYLWRYPHEFSGGQRQRIGLARALVLNPEFIVCDEITSALDVSVQAEILQLLLDIRSERDLTLLFVTHNIGVVEYLSDQTVVMYKGKIVERGLTEQVCRNPQEPYTQKLLAAVPRLTITAL
ncbi:ABC transporter ATP-binding protein [Thiolinea disciformis]|uniref:ABC transporter ATP-binding protein n=1 Tax=Thiolinea disciformis TaxID=125614 RepID=UPI000368C325|nr:dipeptide ABC transporter ATP-binding protein [Thiolinea disciformis]